MTDLYQGSEKLKVPGSRQDTDELGTVYTDVRRFREGSISEFTKRVLEQNGIKVEFYK